MKPTTICFMVPTPPTKTNYQQFGIELLESRGFQTLILDFTQILNPDYSKKYQPPNLLDSINIVRFKTRNEFSVFLSNNRDIIVADFIGGSSETLFIYRYFKKFCIQYINLSVGSIPAPTILSSKGNLLLKKIAQLHRPKMVFQKLKSYLMKKIYAIPYYISGLQPPQYLLVDGYRHPNRPPLPDTKTQVIWAHTWDYDLYLENQNKPSEKSNYCVFIDDYLPFHPDFILFPQLAISVNPDNYYNCSNRFFDYFEATFKMPVIIAAHPKSRYDLMPHYFPGREIKKDQTVNLISNSKCVLTMASTAINFAVLYRKPIIFLTMNELTKNYYGALITAFAAEFNKKPININQDLATDIKNELLINEDSYNRYISNYIKTPNSPEKPFWDIVANQILSKKT